MITSPDAATTVRSLVQRIGGDRGTTLPVTLRFWDGSELSAGPEAPVVGVQRRALGHLLHEPNQLGLVRAYVRGELALESGRLEDVLAHRAAFGGLHATPADLALAAAALVRLGGADALRPPEVPAIELRPRGRRHSTGRDAETVRHHYDVSNAFYRALLGPSLVYSCAYYDDATDTLEAAQERKLERICRKLRLHEGERMLDIGCGWGSLVLHAAEHHGVRAVGVTISGEQAELARERVRERGLEDRIEIRVADYREIADGPYDKIASIGMYEHVGYEQLDAYAAIVERLLAPGGLALNHGISGLFSTPAGPKSLIQRYVFPDGELLPVGDVIGALQRAGLETRDVESMREHYALTLRAWLANLAAHRDALVAEAGEDRVRVWELYLLGSALAFEDADISIFQVLVAKGGAPHGLPLARTDLVSSPASAP